MLELPSIGQLPAQRQSIPAVLVDEAVDPNRLTLLECHPRRSSTGRVLPKIPIEQSRSLLDLPAQTHSSTSSLDLPLDQPRRASAPEGENIRIVIDDVDSTGLRNRNSRIERVILHRDENFSVNVRTRGFGLCVMGGKLDEGDGKLYAYVSWTVHGGPADKMGLKPGDKILEWDGKSLVNLSYEQVCAIIDSSAKTAELIIEPLNREECKGYLFHQKRRLSQASTQNSIDFGLSHQTSQSPLLGNLGRRKLPRTPDMSTPPSTPAPMVSINQQPSSGELLCHISIDPDQAELTVVLHRARGLGVSGFPCYAQIQTLPSLGFATSKTEPSSSLEWNEALTFQPFPVEKAIDMALEVNIWEDSGTELRSLGDTVIPIANAVGHQADWWPLLCQGLPASPTDFNALLLPHEDNHQSLGNHLSDHYPRSMSSVRRNSERIEHVHAFQNSDIRTRSSLDSSPSNSLDSSPSRLHSRLGRHSAIDMPPTVDSLALPGEGSSNCMTGNGSNSPREVSKLRRKSSSALGRISRTFSLKGGVGAAGGNLSHAQQPDTSRKTAKGQVAREAREAREETTGQSSEEEEDEALVSESDSVSSLAGYQFADLGYNDCSVVGELKLGLIMTKVLLEIEVIGAKGLPLNSMGQPPDTYVKTYLKEPRKPPLHKQKTSVIYGSRSPQYKQTITYDAHHVTGKKLLVMVWEKKQRINLNNLIGGVDIEVNKLQLYKLTIGWYKLFHSAKI